MDTPFDLVELSLVAMTVSYFGRLRLRFVTASFFVLRTNLYHLYWLYIFFYILEHLQKSILYLFTDNLRNEVVQSDTKGCDNEGICSGMQYAHSQKNWRHWHKKLHRCCP